MARLEYIVSEGDAGRRLSRVALSAMGMSHGQFKRAKFCGSITLGGEPARADAEVSAGQIIVIDVPETATYTVKPYALSLNVPYEDEHIMIVDKPAPLPSVPSRGKEDGFTLENAVYAHLGCPEGFCYHPVNRLDSGTSGLMAIAKTAHAQQLMQRALHTDDFLREYLAVCEGAPPKREGVIDAPIRREDAPTIRRVVGQGGKRAVTRYRVIQSAGEKSLIRLTLETGRTHQIRAHMAYIGCPVAGDFLYGREHVGLPRRFALHSCKIALRHPITGESICIESELPKELAALMG